MDAIELLNQKGKNKIEARNLIAEAIELEAFSLKDFESRVGELKEKQIATVLEDSSFCIALSIMARALAFPPMPRSLTRWRYSSMVHCLTHSSTVLKSWRKNVKGAYGIVAVCASTAAIVAFHVNTALVLLVAMLLLN